jgi:nitroimidazol reductase NimA-like FMN-containing flavoprotein (pyridoxamine 5'-phosphate oxidase superfamily)
LLSKGQLKEEFGMSQPRMTDHECQAFLAEPRVGVLSIASDDGRPPLTVPLWYGYQPGGTLSFFTGTGGHKARKTRLIQKAGVVSLCVQQDEIPYKYVTVEGTVVQTDQPPSSEQMLAIARRYLPEEQAQGFVDAELARPSAELVLFTIRPDRWLSADFSDAAG